MFRHWFVGCAAIALHIAQQWVGFTLPPGVPVLAVSRNTLGYWGDRCPRNPLLLVPNAIEPAWLERGARGSAERRPIDVLVQARKSSRYVLEQLVPALRQRGLRVEVQSGWGMISSICSTAPAFTSTTPLSTGEAAV